MKITIDDLWEKHLFRQDNTEGYTDKQLEKLNQALVDQINNTKSFGRVVVSENDWSDQSGEVGEFIEDLAELVFKKEVEILGLSHE